MGSILPAFLVFGLSDSLGGAADLPLPLFWLAKSQNRGSGRRPNPQLIFPPLLKRGNNCGDGDPRPPDRDQNRRSFRSFKK
jgi:hypothetical protein